MLVSTLLVLTLMGDGSTRVTLSEHESPDHCEAARESVVAILTEAGMAPLAARCGETALRLTPFEHGMPAEAEVHRYRVDMPAAGGFAVAPLGPDTPCTPQPGAEPVVICARSGQEVLADG
ncbi:hypothetical protein EOM89_12290 [Candidatus Falkowbacteria bacterium]|nr:hypothetical protein [Candidatus Falkowbacteria bacterium]